MNENEYMDDELKDAPLLKSMGRENPFKVPEGYFDSFPSIISERIASQKSPKESIVTKPGWIILFQNIFRPEYVVAMFVFAAVLASGIVYFNQHKTTDQEIILSYDDLSKSNYIDQIDEHDLIDAYISDADADKSNENNSDIENYIIDNQTDISLIENEL